MPKKKDDNEAPEELAEQPPVDQVTKPQKARGGSRKGSKASKVVEVAPLYISKPWKGVETVHVCAKCDQQMNDEDSMKLHVVGHLPPDEREAALNKLLKE